jgi:spermidine synthase
VRRGVVSGAYLLAVLASILLSRATGQTLLSPDVVEARPSLYNDIVVMRQGPYLTLGFGHGDRRYVESTVHPRDERQLPSPYTRSMMAGLFYAGGLSSILDIGSGGGRTAWYVHKFLPSARVTSVELDPAVVDIAQKHFGVRTSENFRLETGDGRVFMTNTADRYDVIMIDAYRGPFVPFHLLTRQFYDLAASRLKDGGVIVQNVEPGTMLFDSAVKTINAVFPNVDLYRAVNNVVIVAYGGPPRDRGALIRTALERQRLYGFRYDLRDLVADRTTLADAVGLLDPSAQVLTDDFAPVDTLRAVQHHNRKWPDPQ